MNLSIGTAISANGAIQRIQFSSLEHTANSNVGNTNNEQLLNRLIQYLKQNIKKTISLQDLCSHHGINRNKAIHLFRVYTNKTPFEWLRVYRMDSAKKLIEAYPEAPIYLIALEVGFDDPNNFSTAFKKHFGISPSKLKKYFS